MQHPVRFLILVAAANLGLTGAALAQSPDHQPSASSVADQFQSGANHLGSGFGQVGEGIKQGAILTWNAIVDGVTTTASHFSGSNPPPKPAQGSQ